MISSLKSIQNQVAFSSRHYRNVALSSSKDSEIFKKNIENCTQFQQTIDGPTVICNISVIFIFGMIFVCFFLIPLNITFTDVTLDIALRFPIDLLIGSGRGSTTASGVIVGGDIDILKISNAILLLNMQMSNSSGLSPQYSYRYPVMHR